MSDNPSSLFKSLAIRTLQPRKFDKKYKEVMSDDDENYEGSRCDLCRKARHNVMCPKCVPRYSGVSVLLKKDKEEKLPLGHWVLDDRPLDPPVFDHIVGEGDNARAWDWNTSTAQPLTRKAAELSTFSLSALDVRGKKSVLAPASPLSRPGSRAGPLGIASSSQLDPKTAQAMGLKDNSFCTTRSLYLLDPEATGGEATTVPKETAKARLGSARGLLPIKELRSWNGRHSPPWGHIKSLQDLTKNNVPLSLKGSGLFYFGGDRYKRKRLLGALELTGVPNLMRSNFVFFESVSKNPLKDGYLKMWRFVSKAAYMNYHNSLDLKLDRRTSEEGKEVSDRNLYKTIWKFVEGEKAEYAPPADGGDEDDAEEEDEDGETKLKPKKSAFALLEACKMGTFVPSSAVEEKTAEGEPIVSGILSNVGKLEVDANGVVTDRSTARPKTASKGVGWLEGVERSGGAGYGSAEEELMQISEKINELGKFSVGFGWICESDLYKVYRIWSRPVFTPTPPPKPKKEGDDDEDED